MSNGARAHWDKVYSGKAADRVSWYASHLRQSLALIERSAPDRGASIIDIGGGASTLADDLLARGYTRITVLDISPVAIDVAKARVGTDSHKFTWIVDDVTQALLPENAYDVWHDRAVFHFLTRARDREAYVQQAVRCVKQGGHVIVATFGTQGPPRCSDLDVARYDAGALHAQFGAAFRLVDHLMEMHRTPFGTEQQFLYCVFQVN